MTKLVNGVEVALSQADIEQMAIDAERFDAESAQRELAEIERADGRTREERDVRIAALPAGHPKRVSAEATEAAIAALGIREEG